MRKARAILVATVLVSIACLGGENPSEPASHEAALETAKQLNLWKKNQDAASQAREAGRYLEAEDFYVAAIQAVADSAPLETNLVESLGDLATLCCQEGHYSLAEPLARQALSIQEEKFGTNHVQAAQFQMLLGMICGQRGNFNEAEQLLLSARSTFVRDLGESHPAVAQSLNQLGQVYLMQHRYADAELVLGNAFEILRKARIQKDVVSQGNVKSFWPGSINITLFRPDPALIADVLSNLGLAFEKEGKLAEAAECMKTALSFYEGYSGKKSLAVAGKLNNLASVQLAQKDFRNAESNLKRSLAIQEKSLGANNPAIIPTLEILAQAYRGENKGEEAGQVAARVLSLQAKGPINKSDDRPAPKN